MRTGTTHELGSLAISGSRTTASVLERHYDYSDTRFSVVHSRYTSGDLS